MRFQPRVAIIVIAAGFLTAAVGCSSGPVKGAVEGKVTFESKPVTEGTVTFVNSKEGGAAEAKLGPGGVYVVQGGVVVGEYHVVITPLMHMVDTDPGRTPPSPEEKPAPDIPQNYRMDGTTPLRATVKSGKNEFNFDMTP